MHVIISLCRAGVMCVLAIGLLAGCGRNNAKRVTVSGKVSFRGQPVPTGIISFTPDVKRGNRGPQGVAKIIDGQYTTDDHGKGSVRGPQLVEIRGFGGNNSGRGDSLPFQNGRPMFPPYFTEADVGDGNSTLDFEVPDQNIATQTKK